MTTENIPSSSEMQRYRAHYQIHTFNISCTKFNILKVHIWSSTADFTLFSPLTSTSIGITSINAVAFYEEDKPVGRINYKEAFNVPPGISQTPHLPVDLVLGGGAYDALRRALGSSLAMDTVAKVGIRVGNYEDLVVYRGKGIEAKVRF